MVPKQLLFMVCIQTLAEVKFTFIGPQETHWLKKKQS